MKSIRNLPFYAFRNPKLYSWANHGDRHFWRFWATFQLIPSYATSNYNVYQYPARQWSKLEVNRCILPELGGYNPLIIYVEYFLKRLEAKSTRNKYVPTVANLLYRLICRDWCIKIQINDQSKKFVSQAEITGKEQRITSAYHQQLNELSKRQNRAIKDSLINVMQKDTNYWLGVFEGVLFAHKVSVHTSAGYPPFLLQYSRHPISPIDTQENLWYLSIFYLFSIIN